MKNKKCQIISYPLSYAYPSLNIKQSENKSLQRILFTKCFAQLNISMGFLKKAIVDTLDEIIYFTK
jgi:hypothetical protein